MTVSAHAAEFQRLFNLIQSRTGLRLREQQHVELMPLLQQLQERPPQSEDPSPYEFLARAPLTDPEWQRLIGVITVGETYFFRNRDQFDVLRYHLLPELLAERRHGNTKRLFLWSAGCASGEEPYSLAILLRDMIDDIHDWDIHILGTDINMVSLDQARRGWYRQWSFRNETPLTLEPRWFHPSDGGFQLDDSIRAMVTFAPLNLLSEDEHSLPQADIIVCRNVGMYLETTAMERVFQRLSNALSSRGWLLTGHAEPMPPSIQGLSARTFANTVVYQKDFDSPFREAQHKPVIKLPPNAEVPAALKSEPPLDALARAEQAANVEDWEGALKWLYEAEQSDMLQPYVHYLRAVVQMHLADSDGAFISLRKAIYCDPNFALAHFMLGEHSREANNFSAAARHWRRARWMLRNLDEGEPLPYQPELTVAELNELIRYRLDDLSGNSDA